MDVNRILNSPALNQRATFVIKFVRNSKTTSLVNNFFCNYPLLDDARSVMSGPFVNGLQTV